MKENTELIFCVKSFPKMLMIITLGKNYGIQPLKGCSFKFVLFNSK